jgi:hypothetical protein
VVPRTGLNEMEVFNARTPKFRFTSKKPAYQVLAINPEARVRFPTLPENKVVGLERGPLRLVRTTEELLDKKSLDFCLENREYGRRNPSR